MPYYVVLTYILMCYMFQVLPIDKKGNLNRFFNYKLGFIVLFLFAALRGNGNGDYATYIHGVTLIDTLSMVINPVNVHFEFGFRLLSYISNSLNLHPQFVLITMNAISIGSVYYFVNKYSNQKELSLLLFYPIMMLFDMHHSRSAVGISLGLIVFDLLYRRKTILSLLPLGIAILFHKSSVILLVLYPIFLIERFSTLQIKASLFPKRKILLLLLTVLIFFFFSAADLILLVFNNNFLMPLYVKLNSYIANGRWSYPFSLLDPRFLILLLTYSLAIFSLSYKKKLNNMFMYMLAISILLIVSLSFSTVLVIRAYNFFNIFIIVFLPNLKGDLSSSKFRKNLNTGNKVVNKFISKHTKFIQTIVYNTVLVGYLVYTIAIITKQYEYFTFLRGII